MIVKVFHCAFGDANVHVATVNSDYSDIDDALDYSYRWTQNFGGSWSIKDGNGDNNDLVTVEVPLHNLEGRTYGLRSTSVGDEMEADGVRYVVASFRFEKKW